MCIRDRYKDKRYTIEIKRKSKTKYYLAQISGYGNSEAPNELIEKINQYLDVYKRQILEYLILKI